MQNARKKILNVTEMSLHTRCISLPLGKLAMPVLETFCSTSCFFFGAGYSTTTNVKVRSESAFVSLVTSDRVLSMQTICAHVRKD